MSNSTTGNGQLGRSTAATTASEPDQQAKPDILPDEQEILAEAGWHPGELALFTSVMVPVRAQAAAFDAMLKHENAIKSQSVIYDYKREKMGNVIGIHRDNRGNYKILAYGNAVEADRLIAKAHRKAVCEIKKKAEMSINEVHITEIPAVKDHRTLDLTQIVPQSLQESCVPQPVTTPDGEAISQTAKPDTREDTISHEPAPKPPTRRRGRARLANSTATGPVRSKDLSQNPRALIKDRGKPVSKPQIVKKPVLRAQIDKKPVPNINVRMLRLWFMLRSSEEIQDEYLKSVLKKDHVFLKTYQPDYRDYGAIIALGQSIRHQFVPVRDVIAPDCVLPDQKPHNFDNGITDQFLVYLRSDEFRHELSMWRLQSKLTIKDFDFYETDWLHPIQLQILLNRLSRGFKCPPFQLGIIAKNFKFEERRHEDEESDTAKALNWFDFNPAFDKKLYVGHCDYTSRGFGFELEAKMAKRVEDRFTIWLGLTKFFEYHAIGPASEEGSTNFSNFDFGRYETKEIAW